MDRQLSSKIINAAIAVHEGLGPGLLESVYCKCLKLELEDKGVSVQSEVDLPVIYRGRSVDEVGFRLDLLVSDQIIVELKSVNQVEPVHKKQLLTYLRLTGKEIGLLINFNVALLKEGIHRVVNSQYTS
jgi:GxxExxY protein